MTARTPDPPTLRRIGAAVLLLGALLVPGIAFAGLGKAREASFRESPDLPLSVEKAFDAALAALRPYGVRQSDVGRGQITSDPIQEDLGPNRYRTTVLCVVQKKGEGSRVSVRAQKEILMDALTPGVFAPAQKWQMVGDNRRIAGAVLNAILRTAGVSPEKAAEGSPSQAPAPSAAAPLPANWEQIQALKAQRNVLMAPIRELDKKVLEILYSPDSDKRQRELASLKDQRMRHWEQIKGRVLEIDQKILELTLQE